MSRAYPADLTVSHGDPCDHCGEPVPASYTVFRLFDAWHGSVQCDHWICLRCMSGVIRRWTREGGVSYRPSDPEAGQ